MAEKGPVVNNDLVDPRRRKLLLALRRRMKGPMRTFDVEYLGEERGA